jgi:hypothetical protein
MRNDTKTLHKFGYTVIQVVEGEKHRYNYNYRGIKNDDWYPGYPKTMDPYSYTATSKVVDIQHRIVTGVEDTYVTLLTQSDVADLEQLKQEYDYMRGLVDESNRILQEHVRENKIRRTNAGVEEAYQHYKFLLSLAE